MSIASRLHDFFMGPKETIEVIPAPTPEDMAQAKIRELIEASIAPKSLADCNLSDLPQLIASGVNPRVLRATIHYAAPDLPDRLWIDFLTPTYIHPNGEFNADGEEMFFNLMSVVGVTPLTYAGTDYATAGTPMVAQSISAEQLCFYVELMAAERSDAKRAASDYTSLLTCSEQFTEDCWKTINSQTVLRILRDIATDYCQKHRDFIAPPQRMLELAAHTLKVTLCYGNNNGTLGRDYTGGTYYLCSAFAVRMLNAAR